MAKHCKSVSDDKKSDCFEADASHAEKFQADSNCEMMSFTSSCYIARFPCAEGHKMHLKGIRLKCSNTLAI